MQNSAVRVRFAPSPTGLMHLGNVRTALMNYLFARQKAGTFILRIEDTDPTRNVDPSATKIIDDLMWLNLEYDEGPIKNGPYAPYFQSQRTHIYQEKLQELQHQHFIYRCFCSPHELEEKRQRQIALKLPPRYDRTCLAYSPEKIKELLAQKRPFIWRVKLEGQSITVHDLARGTINFDLNHFSDFPLTRQDGSFTFMFANFVDDSVMKISHVLRGEDHISNTAGQAALYHMLKLPLPLFWHLPILCNSEGKKLSKRDFGFSLNDLKNGGYLPEAINNYLALIGGGTFKNEIMSQKELIRDLNFDTIHPTSHIRYNVEKLNWVNHQWITQYTPDQLTYYARPFIEKVYPEARTLDQDLLTKLIQTIKTDIKTLTDIPNALQFYFEAPHITFQELVKHHINIEQSKALDSLIRKNIDTLGNTDLFIATIKKAALNQHIPIAIVFSFLRLRLMGKTKGPSIHDLLDMLGTQESSKRFTAPL